ncbi:MAG: glycine betaine/L-proline ABC transporter ATP-binding protein [Hyphomicrobiaceae bacterium]
MALIEIENVSKIFGKDPKSVLPLVRQGRSKDEILKQTGHVVGLNEVTLSVEQGEVFVVMGLSGSGKSTLIRHINRLIEPTSGAIHVHGRDILKASPGELQRIRQTQMSMVFQRFGLMPHRTVAQNVAYGLEARGESEATRRAAADRWIARVGLTGYEQAYPSMLSGGMQQRVGLARALATDPEILLMDEAFSALDPLIRHDMQKVLLELQRELRKSIVFITHDLDEALAIGDRIAILQDGRLVQVGRSAEIILEPKTDYVRRFVAGVNRGRALKASDIMQPVRAIEAPSVSGDSILEKVLPIVMGTVAGVRVTDARQEPVGFITRERLVHAIVSGTLE